MGRRLALDRRKAGRACRWVRACDAFRNTTAVHSGPEGQATDACKVKLSVAWKTVHTLISREARKRQVFHHASFASQTRHSIERLLLLSAAAEVNGHLSNQDPS